MTTAEDAFEEALYIFRRLAMSNPSVYQPDVGSVLNNLAVLEWELGKVAQARTHLDEAIRINTELWKMNPASMGDGLAWTLLINTMVPTESERPTSELCNFASQAEAVAYDGQLKETAVASESMFCNQL